MHVINPFWHGAVGGGGGSDPNFANVAGLWHFNDTAGSQTFVDSSANNNSITSIGATCATSAGQVKFGACSVYRTSTSSDLAKANNIAAYAFGTADFTIEFWWWATTLVTVRYIFGMAPTFSAPGNTANMYTWSDGRLTYERGALTDTAVAGTVATGVWQAIAYDRAGSTGRLYVNGVVVKTLTDSMNYNTGTAVVQVGASSAYAQDAYWDEMRITNGVARYQGAYTPAVAAFPDS